MNRAFDGLRPDEAAALQTLGKETQSVAILPEPFNEIATPATEDKNVTTEGIGPKLLLGDGRQTIKPSAHVSLSGREPDPGAGRQADHRGRSVERMVGVNQRPILSTSQRPIVSTFSIC